MALNLYTSRQEVLDAYNARFFVEAPYLKYANREIINRSQEWDLAEFGNGITVQVRRRPTTRGTTLDATTLNGPVTKTFQSVEMQTINVTVDTVYYAPFEINSVNEVFYLNGKAVTDETILGAVQDQQYKVTGYLYERLLLNSRILAGSPSSSLGNQTSLGRINEKATLHNMPALGCLLTSLRAGTDIQASFGPYFNTKASNPALTAENPTLGYFGDLKSYHNVKQFKTGDAVNDNGTTNVQAIITNGATSIPLQGLTPGAIIRVGSPLEFDDSNLRSVGRGAFNIISTTEDKPSFIVASDSTNPDFTAGPPPGENANFTFLSGVEGYYTADGSGEVTIPITTPINLTGNFQNVLSTQTIANQIAVGTLVNFFADHVAGNYITDSGISWASPRLKRIMNSEVEYSDNNGISLRWSVQGDLSTDTNIHELASLYGAGFDPAYLIRVMSNN